MTFKFTASIDSPDARALWTRSIYALSVVSDVIKLTIRQCDPNKPSDPDIQHAEVLLTAVNLSKTASLNCCFRDSFFGTFTVEGQLPYESLAEDPNKALSFSFLANSKTLNVLFKECGDQCTKAKLMLIWESDRDQMEHPIIDSLFANKLFIEFETRTDMTKRYTVHFRPGKEAVDLQIRYNFQTRLTAQYGKPIDEVKHLIVDTFIVSNFIRMFPGSIDDFRIEVFPNSRKLVFHGFNRQDALSVSKRLDNLAGQPMSLSIEINLNDVAYENIVQDEDPQANRKAKDQVSLRLRDLRVFIQLISVNYGTFEQDSDDSAAYGTNYCEMMFSTGGEPIAFERRYSGGDGECCTITLMSITDSEGGRIELDGRGRVQLEAAEERDSISRRSESARPESARSESRTEPLFVGDAADELTGMYDGMGNDAFWGGGRPIESTRNPASESVRSEAPLDLHLTPIPEANREESRVEPIEEEEDDTELSSSAEQETTKEDEGNTSIQGHETQQGMGPTQGLGPTQKDAPVKGIFD